MFITRLSYVAKEDRVNVFQPAVVSNALPPRRPRLLLESTPDTAFLNLCTHMQVCTYFHESFRCVLDRLDSDVPDEGDNGQTSVIQPANVNVGPLHARDASGPY